MCYPCSTWTPSEYESCSSAVRGVTPGPQRGETLGVTDRGRLVAILAPPSAAGGVGGADRSGARAARPVHGYVGHVGEQREHFAQRLAAFAACAVHAARDD